MTDEELIKRLRDVDHLSVEDCFLQSPLYTHAADRIEGLMWERDAAWKKVAEADARITNSALDALAAYGQAQDAHEAQLEAEAKLDKAVEALRAFKDFDDMPTSHKRLDVFELRVRRKLLSTLAGIEGPI